MRLHSSPRSPPCSPSPGDALALDGSTLYVRKSTTARPLRRPGFALYAFTHDLMSKSRCYGACAKAWPPYLAKSPRAAAGRSGPCSARPAAPTARPR